MLQILYKEKTMNIHADVWDKRKDKSQADWQWCAKHGGYIPRNRPCDWCGKLVTSGYIHPECLVKERHEWIWIIEG